MWDMWLRVLDDFNWSIHENCNQSVAQLTHNQRIKDQMREADVAAIVETWFLFLAQHRGQAGAAVLALHGQLHFDRHRLHFDAALPATAPPLSRGDAAAK